MRFPALVEEWKLRAAERALGYLEEGMLVGLGTGSTAAFAIGRLGEMVRGGLDIRAVATSLRTESMARMAGIALVAFATVESVDLTIDGADEIDGRLFAIKGAGGAMLREKIVAAASRRMIVIADDSKRVERIGKAKLPVEVLPFARAFTATRLAALGAKVVQRDARSDQGNIILDCFFAEMPDPCALGMGLSAIPGVLGHGLFLDEVDCAYIGGGGRVIRLDR
jgi:ribose 5-phosphate isomerase A